MVCPYNNIIQLLKNKGHMNGTTWMNMENIIVGERSQAQKATHVFKMSRTGKSLDIEGNLVFFIGGWEGRIGCGSSGCRVSFWVTEIPGVI